MRKYKTWVSELVPSPDETGISGETIDVYVASDVDTRIAELAARIVRLAKWADWMHAGGDGTYEGELRDTDVDVSPNGTVMQ